MGIPKQKVLAWLFNEGAALNGGDFRSQQVLEVLRSSDALDVTISGKSNFKDNKMRCMLAGCVRCISMRTLPSLFPRGLARFGAEYLRFRQLKNSKASFDVVVWETTGEPSTSRLLRELGRKLVAVPQNIEALGAMRVSSIAKNSSKLRKELYGLKVADCVFTISPEEAWLLRLFGLPADCLPYYPPKVC